MTDEHSLGMKNRRDYEYQVTSSVAPRCVLRTSDLLQSQQYATTTRKALPCTPPMLHDNPGTLDMPRTLCIWAHLRESMRHTEWILCTTELWSQHRVL
jgi:hypothetical protein